MALRLLNALEYPAANTLNINDESSFRALIAWLEQTKIKLNTTNSTQLVRNVKSNDWPNYYTKYKEEIGSPGFLDSRQAELQWLLGYAIQLETHNKKDVYIKQAVENLKISNVPSVVAENPLDKLDFQSKDFSDGINGIAKILKITPHPNPLVTLKAVSMLVNERLTAQALENPQEHIIKGTPFPFQNTDLGFDLHDVVLNQAAKILRMLYIHDLRDLQTRANELIVAAQSVTANPKTDTQKGQVGRL